jgi:hypothetical protein
MSRNAMDLAMAIANHSGQPYEFLMKLPLQDYTLFLERYLREQIAIKKANKRK